MRKKGQVQSEFFYIIKFMFSYLNKLCSSGIRGLIFGTGEDEVMQAVHDEKSQTNLEESADIQTQQPPSDPSASNPGIEEPSSENLRKIEQQYEKSNLILYPRHFSDSALTEEILVQSPQLMKEEQSSSKWGSFLQKKQQTEVTKKTSTSEQNNKTEPAQKTITDLNAAHSKNIEILQLKNKDLKSQLEQSQSKAKEEEGKRIGLQSKLGGLRNQLSDSTTKIFQNQKKISELEKSLQEQTSAHSRDNDVYEAEKRRMLQLISQMTDQSERKDTAYQGRVTQLKQQVRNLQKLLKDANDKIKNLENEMSLAHSRMDSDKDGLNQTIKDQAKKISDLIEESNAARRDIALFQSELNVQLSELLGGKVAIEVNTNNFQKGLNELVKQHHENMAKLLFLPESQMYASMDEESKNFVYRNISRITNKSIKASRTLFCAYSKFDSWEQWREKILDRPNILVMLTLENGQQIGGFSENPYSKTDLWKRGRGYLMSITKKICYDVREAYAGKVARFNEYAFMMGNNQLMLYNNMTFKLMMGTQYLHFPTKDLEYIDFINEDISEGNFKEVEFHQIQFMRKN